MTWSNYDDVLQQLQDGGLIVDHLEVGVLRRCSIEGSREKKGWYALHELRLDDGDVVLVGSFGIWSGPDNNGAQKVELSKRRALTAEQRAGLRARISEDRRRAAAQRKRLAERAAAVATRAWGRCTAQGGSAYLERKGVHAHGVRFSDRGNLVVPMCDAKGHIHGLQIIYGDPRIKLKKGRDKDYWPAGLSKYGHYHLIGSPGELVLVTEGYATGATLYEATGLPVAVAFDAGNLRPVAEILHKTYRSARILICADDDYITKCPACNRMTEVAVPECSHCGHQHGKMNAGIDAATAAALSVDGAWVAPRFEADRAGKKLTDYNDLMVAEGLHVVRAQIEARLGELRWRSSRGPAPGSHEGGGGRKSILTIDEACERFTIIYGGKSTIFDHQEHLLVPKSDVLDLLPEHGWRTWKERGDARRIALVREVGFDPSERDQSIRCNLWGGWPTSPRAGSCESLLDLLSYLCSGEQNSGDLYRWILKWLAYPIQHPGAKMRTSLVFHGPQGAGKNLFFEAYMAIYGEYGRIVDQTAIEDKFNDWASKKLFLIADEVVARAELFHVKNKLKSFVTSDHIRINPKNVTAYDERNHVNIVFLSNETQPLVPERDDRRHVVVWTPQKMPEHFYKEVRAELDAGGSAALHHHLLHLDLGDFSEYAQPPMTEAKSELIEISMDSVERFMRQWLGEELDPVPIVPVRSADLYKLYRTWCARQGYPRYAPEVKFLGEISRRSPVEKRPARYLTAAGDRQVRFVFPPKVEAEPGKSQATWLGECVERFTRGMERWEQE